MLHQLRAVMQKMDEKILNQKRLFVAIMKKISLLEMLTDTP